MLAYNPAGEHFVEVDPAAAPPVIDLSVAPDTLMVWGEVTLTYAVDTGGRDFLGVVVYFGERQVASATSGTSIGIRTQNVPDGTYPLRLEVRARSGTGSLADRAGREVVAGEITRVVVVDNAPPGPAEDLTVGPADGTLRVSWRPYERFNFQQYRLYRVRDDGGRELQAVIEEADVNHWDIDYFLGGTISYAVDIAAAGQVSTGAIASYEAPGITLDSELLQGHRIKLRWTPSIFPRNVAAYSLLRAQRTWVGWGPFEEVLRTTDPTVASFTDAPEPLFGHRYHYKLVAIPVGEGLPVETQVESDIDRRVDLSAPIVFLSSTGSFVGRDLQWQRLVRLDAETLEERASVGQRGVGAISADPGGSMLAVPISSVLYLRDPVTLDVQRTLNLEALLGDNPVILDGSPAAGTLQRAQPVITEQGLYGFSLARFRSPTVFAGQGAHVIDLNAGTYIGGIARDNAVVMSAASPDLGFIIVQFVSGDRFELYVRDREAPRGYSLVSRIEDHMEQPNFYFIDREHYLVILPTGAVRAVHAPTRTVAWTMRIDPLTAPRYDAAHRLIVGIAANGNVRAFDLDTGARLFDVGVAPTVGSDVTFAGGVLWSGGYYRRVLPAP